MDNFSDKLSKALDPAYTPPDPPRIERSSAETLRSALAAHRDACIPIRWNTHDDMTFLMSHKGSVETLRAGVQRMCADIVGMRDAAVGISCDDARQALRVMGRLYDETRRAYGFSSNAIDALPSFGGMLRFPSSPEGFATIRILRDILHHSTVHGDAWAQGYDSHRAFLAALEDVQNHSALIGGVYNATTKSPRVGCAPGSSYVFQVDFTGPNIIRTLPRGSAPATIRGKSPIGMMIDNAEELREACDMCDDGTESFLQRHDIGYARNSYECDQCGQTSEDDSCGSFEHIDDFEMTAEMWEDICRQGFEEKALEALDCTGSDLEWSEFLGDYTDAEILANCAPEDDGGLKYDRDAWEFVPDFGSVEDIDDADTETLIRLLPLLQRIADAHAAVGSVPPIPGELRSRSSVAAAYAGKRSRGWEWNPDTETFTHRIAPGVSILADCKGNARLRSSALGMDFGIGTDTLQFSIAAHNLGIDASLALGLIQGSVDL